MAQSIAITLSALNAPHEWQWSYFLMILAHLALFATAAGHSYGVDGALRPLWEASRNRFAFDHGEAVMSAGRFRSSLISLGLASIVAALFVFDPALPGALRFVTVGWWDAVALFLFGVVAILGGLFRGRALAVVSGAGLLLCSIVQLVQTGHDANLLGGNASAVAVLGGLGIGVFFRLF